MRFAVFLAVAGAIVLTAFSPAHAQAQPRDIEVGLVIWNQADAEERCTKAAAQVGAKWTGRWSNTTAGRMSVCEVVDLPPDTQRAAVAPKAAGRAVEAGPIWNQADAELKCPAAAAAVGGRWAGDWRTTERGRMSSCDVVDIQPRDVQAGPIWNQADAAQKCPVVAAAVHGRWTGQWVTKETGRMSVCQIAD